MKKIKTGAHVDQSLKYKFMFACVAALLFVVCGMAIYLFANNVSANAVEQNAAAESDGSIQNEEQAATAEIVQPAAEEKATTDVTGEDASTITGHLFQGTGGGTLVGNNPYVWPVALVEDGETYKPYVGNIIYTKDDGKFSIEWQIDWVAVFIIAGADNHQTVVRFVDDLEMGGIPLPTGRTTTGNTDASGVNTVLLKAGSTFHVVIPEMEPVDIDLPSDIDLGKKFPAIGFATGGGETSTFDFKDDGKFDYAYRNQEGSLVMNMNMEITHKADYHFYCWNNEYYEGNEAEPASSIKVINPDFRQETMDLTGNLVPGTGQATLEGNKPYVWPFGLNLTSGDTYIGKPNYNISGQGNFVINVPSDYDVFVLVCGANMHQTDVHFVTDFSKSVGDILLYDGKTTTINNESEGFNTTLVKKDSTITVEIPGVEEPYTIPLDKDIDLGKNFPAIGFASGQIGEEATFDFGDSGVANYKYSNKEKTVNVDIKLEVTALANYHFVEWNNELYPEPVNSVKASTIKVINPVFAKGGEPSPEPTPAGDGSALAQTFDNVDCSILFAIVALVAGSGVYIVARKRFNK